MPRAGIKYTHRSDKSWRLSYRFVLDNSREQRVHVTLVFRFKSAVEFCRWKFSLRILVPSPLLSLFFVSGSRMRDPFFFSFILFHTTSRADRIFQHDLHDKSFRFEQNLPCTWVSKKWNSETFVYVTPLNFKQFHWSELDFQDK